MFGIRQTLNGFDEKIEYMYHSITDIRHISQDLVNRHNFRDIKEIHNHLDTIVEIFNKLKKENEENDNAG